MARNCLVAFALLAAVLAFSASSADAATAYKPVGEIAGPEPGVHFGTLRSESVAINDKNGHVLVADSHSGTVYDFESPTDTTPTAFGGFGGGVVAVAVENASGDFYVADSTDKVIRKFEADGTAITSWATAGVLSGSETPATDFSPAAQGSFGIAVDQTDGDLYAIDAGNEAIDVFNAAGAYQRQILGSVETEGLFGCAGEGRYTDGIAVDGAAGELFVSDSCTVETYVFETGGTYLGALEGFGTGYTTVAADEASETVYISATSEHLVKALTYSGAPIGELANVGTARGLAVDQVTSALYVSEENNGTVEIFQPTVVPDVTLAPPSALTKTSATLNGEVDPAGGGPITECHFVVSGGIGNVPCEPPTPYSAPTAVSATVALQPNITYSYRLVAANANGASESNGEEEFRTPGPPLIEAASVADVSSEAATLQATINPELFATAYRFEYISEADFLADGEAFGAGTKVIPVSDGQLGSGGAGVEIEQMIAGLAASTTYRYRVLAASVEGPASSAPGSFTTQPGLPSATLLDSREWEMVSPAQKHGALIEPINIGVTQAAAGGDAFTYLSINPPEVGAPSNANDTQNLAVRTSDGWTSKAISLPYGAAPGQPVGNGEEYRAMSADLSSAVVGPLSTYENRVAPAASEISPLLRANFSPPGSNQICGEGCYQPLVTGCPPAGQACPAAVAALANVPPGTKFGPATRSEGCMTFPICGPQFVAATPNFKHLVIQSETALTSDPDKEGAYYEWSGGRLRFLADRTEANAIQEISADGAIVVIKYRFGGEEGLLAVDSARGESVRIDEVQGATNPGPASAPSFQLLSSDGHTILFSDQRRLTADSHAEEEEPDLYRCTIEETPGGLHCRLTDLTPEAAGGTSADVLGLALGGSQDGESIYFVADGALAPGAVAGDCGTPHAESQRCNLYALSGAAPPRLVAVLSGSDYPDWQTAGSHTVQTTRTLHTARVSPSGQWVAFQSQRPLTGYDNRDVRSGERDQEVFLYDAASGRVICASCNPTGARPLGFELGGGSTNAPLQHLGEVWESTSWLSATVPAWTSYATGLSVYQPRYLSDSGRLFFDSRDALVPADSNREGDVYEFEPAGIGNCEAGDTRFVAAESGCVDLISSGTSAEAAFLDASESGDDVFLISPARLAASDNDSALDIYDARVCGVARPCLAETQAPAGACSGETCLAVGSQPAEAAPGTETFVGPSNPRSCRKGTVRKGGKCVKAAKKKSKAKHHKKHHAKGAKKKRRAGSDKGGKR